MSSGHGGRSALWADSVRACLGEIHGEVARVEEPAVQAALRLRLRHLEGKGPFSGQSPYSHQYGRGPPDTLFDADDEWNRADSTAPNAPFRIVRRGRAGVNPLYNDPGTGPQAILGAPDSGQAQVLARFLGCTKGAADPRTRACFRVWVLLPGVLALWPITSSPRRHLALSFRLHVVGRT